MQVSALFILSTIYLAECYRISVTPRNSNALADISESDLSSNVAIKEHISKLSLNNSKLVVAESLLKPTNEANSLPSANFEENPILNTESGYQSNIVNNSEDAKSPVFSSSQIPELQQPPKQSSLLHSAFTSAAEKEENQNEGSDINKNAHLLNEPQNQTDLLSALLEHKNQNSSTPIFTNMSSVHSDLSTVNSQSELISSYEANSKLPQPTHSSSTSNNLPDLPLLWSAANQDSSVSMPLLTTNKNHVKLLVPPNNRPVQSELFIENGLSPQNSTSSTTNSKLPQPPQFQGSSTNLPVPPQFSSSANQNSAAPITTLFSINLNHNRPTPPASTNNVSVQSTLLTVNNQIELNSTNATNSKFPQPPQSQGLSANLPVPPQFSSSVNQNSTVPILPLLPTNANRPKPPASTYNVPAQSVVLTVNTQSQTNSISATSSNFPLPPQPSSSSANRPVPPQSMSVTKHRPTPPSTSTLNRPVPPVAVYAMNF